jgi:membrane protein
MQPGACARLLREAFREWLKDDASLLAAALAYYGLFSFVPLFILTLILINFLFQYGVLDGQTAALSADLVGRQMPDTADDMLELASDRAGSFRFTLASLILLLFGAGGLFINTRRALHIIWKLPEKRLPFLDWIGSYLYSYLLIGLVAFLLLATSLSSALVLTVGRQIEALLPIHLGLLRALTFLVSFSFVTILFAATYIVLIEDKLGWQEVLAGSALASLLFSAGNFCIEAYLGWADIGSAYGAAGSLVVFVFWVYYSAQIYLFGAEVIKVKRRHSCQ